MLRILFYIYLAIPISCLVGAEQDFYPNSYGDARKSFLQSLWELKKLNYNYEHEELRVQSTLHPELFIDSVYIAPLKLQKRLFVLSSGMHGAEAPLGSALQVQLLRQLVSKIDRSECGILLLHALNPFGFLSGRRVTENNVDLNRNFLVSGDSFQKQRNEAYDEYKNLFSKQAELKYSWLERLKLSFNLAAGALRGAAQKQKITRAFAQGQYVDPKGIYYGGSQYEAQVSWVDAILSKKMHGYAELIHYDVHTGLGKASELQLISSLDTHLDSALSKELAANLSNVNGVRIVSPRSEGFYVTSGDFIDFVYAKAVQAGLSAATFTAEFGTLGDDTLAQLKTSMRIVLENRVHHWGASTEAEKLSIKKDFEELFNPSSKEWRASVMKIGSDAMSATLKINTTTGALQKAQ